MTTDPPTAYSADADATFAGWDANAPPTAPPTAPPSAARSRVVTAEMVEQAVRYHYGGQPVHASETAVELTRLLNAGKEDG